ncbi:carboxymuconolactone decarboxylase family protein [Sphaerisporangium aureirubrum]|uniref:Carboxymuconolactone decarboxylase family protein n=1 Tax=Sphaerisporangium aureirubrum TaxID=1544736 RepID=A0ABW1NKI8_9ACTN
MAPKVKEFVYIAMDAAATHLYTPGVRQHIRAALTHRATADEIMEVLAIISVLGIHAVTEAAPILQQELPADHDLGWR